MAGEFSREWPDAGEPLYILESADLDLVKLYAVPRPARIEFPESPVVRLGGHGR